MYDSFWNKESNEETKMTSEKDIKDLIQEQICEYLCEINLLIQDVYINQFKTMFKRVYETNKDATAEAWKAFMLQLFRKEKKPENPDLPPPPRMPEVEEAMKYKTLSQLYEEYADPHGKESLSDLLIKQLIGAKNTEVENSILQVLIGYYLPKTEFVGHLENLFIIADDKCKKKYKTLSSLMPDMSDCLNQLGNWLNVTDTKTLIQSASHLEKWKQICEQLYSLFNDEDMENKLKGGIQLINKKDKRFTHLFMKARAYSLIIGFLKLTAKVKLDAAANVLKGNEQLGLYAVTFSRELLRVIDHTNKILTIFCKDSSQAKEYIICY